jgi:ABC-type Fe3+/spermidine/putrescine transport system ATPase subunit
MDSTAAGPTSGGCAISIGEFSFVAGQGDEDTRGQAKVTIRPERVNLEPQGASGPNRVPGMVERVVYVGSVLQVIVNLAPGQRIQAWVQNEGGAMPFESGAPVTVHFPPEALRVLPEAGATVMESGELEEQ